MIYVSYLLVEIANVVIIVILLSYSPFYGLHITHIYVLLVHSIIQMPSDFIFGFVSLSVSPAVQQWHRTRKRGGKREGRDGESQKKRQKEEEIKSTQHNDCFVRHIH